jgi:glycosyltransferase involved in cell wall biosynthesis
MGAAWSGGAGGGQALQGEGWMGMDEPGRLLERADAARDARRWSEAAEAYGAYLRLRPDDRGIIVQRGHCLKEAGDPGAALALYRQAEAMEPDEPDIHLQIGHALKLLGRTGAAVEAYGRSMLLDPLANPAWEEWRALLSHIVPHRPQGPVLDLSDLLAWFTYRRVPSGIQRVQAEIAAVSGGTTLCAMHPEEPFWQALPAPLFQRLYRLSRTGAGMEDLAWQDALNTLVVWRRLAPPLALGAGAILVTLGSAWGLPHHAPALRAARAAGACYVPVLHDCGPLLPDVTDAGTRARFARWFAALPVMAEGVVAVSHATATDYRRQMERHLSDWPAPPVRVVRPDGRHEVPGEEEAPAPEEVPAPAGTGLFGLALRRQVPPPSPRTPRAGRAHPDLPEGPFVLLVSSLEPRKNHALALAAWRMLLDRRGAAGTPRLVFAGRRAPGDEAVMAMLAADPTLAAHVTCLHDLDDAALDRLYRFCLFTLYPSRHEGWGLPVSESLLHRRVPLVAEIPALMESGQHGAVFFTPNSAEDLAVVAEGLIADPSRLAAAAARIPRGGGLRPWTEVAEDLLAAARRLAGTERELPPVPLSRCIALGHGELSDPASRLAWAEAVQEGGGWHPAEAWGAWTRPGRAMLRLPVASEEPIRVALSLRPPPGAQGLVRLTLSRAGAAPATVERRAADIGESALEIGAGGPELRLALESEPGTPLPGEEPVIAVGAGVESVAVMRGQSPADRIAYLEARILVPAQPV